MKTDRCFNTELIDTIYKSMEKGGVGWDHFGPRAQNLNVTVSIKI